MVAVHEMPTLSECIEIGPRRTVEQGDETEYPIMHTAPDGHGSHVLTIASDLGNRGDQVAAYLMDIGYLHSDALAACKRPGDTHTGEWR